jgi:hypothetical protein
MLWDHVTVLIFETDTVETSMFASVKHLRGLTLQFPQTRLPALHKPFISPQKNYFPYTG